MGNKNTKFLLNDAYNFIFWWVFFFFWGGGWGVILWVILMVILLDVILLYDLYILNIIFSLLTSLLLKSNQSDLFAS